MSSMLMASYTMAGSRLPVLPSSSRSSWRPSVAFKSSCAIKSRRPLTVTRALPEKERRPTVFSIPPTALLSPVPPPDGKERWNIKEDDDRVTLWLQVPGASAKDIEVTTTAQVLEIKRKVATAGSGNSKEAADVHGVGPFHIRLLMTNQYDFDNVKADLKDGMLEVIIYKDQQSKGKTVQLGAQPPGRDDASPRVSDETKRDTKGRPRRSI